MADYVITGYNGTVTRVTGYRIQGNRMFLQDSSGSINVYGIKSVVEENPSEDAVEMKNELILEVCKNVDDLTSREKAVMDAQSERISKIDGPACANTFDSRRKKAYIADLVENRGRLDGIMDAWRNLSLPDFSLLLVRDIKILQLLSLQTSIDQTVKFVKSGDPTYREQAKAQMGMARSFDENYARILPWK
jgi:hypothetical protein